LEVWGGGGAFPPGASLVSGCGPEQAFYVLPAGAALWESDAPAPGDLCSTGGTCLQLVWEGRRSPAFRPADLAGAAVLSPDGNDSEGCGSWGSPCATIAHALAVPADDAGRVFLKPGLYRGAGNSGGAFAGRARAVVRSFAGRATTRIECGAGEGLRISDAAVTLEGVTISGCRSASGGCLSSARSELRLRDVSLRECAAVGALGDGNDARGGGLYCTGGEVLAERLTVSNSSAHYGGGAFFDGCLGRLSQGDVAGNTLTRPGKGGGLSLENGSHLVLQSLNITGNGAFFAGGLYVENSAPTLQAVRIAGNTAVYGGGVLLTEGADATMQRVEVFDNEAKDFGGGVLVEGSTPNIVHATFLRNNAGLEGGAIYLHGGASCSLRNSLLSNNTARSGGGVYAREGSVLQAGSVTVEGNVAAANGGGLYLEKGSVVGEGCTLRLNRAGNGGGLYCSGCDADLTGANVEGNSARLSGGGLFVDALGRLRVHGGVARANSADTGGAGFIVGRLDCLRAVFEANRATSGAGLFLDSGDDQLETFSLQETTFEANSARQNGGGVHVSTARGRVSACSFVQNAAAGAGGALAVDRRGSATVETVSCLRNRAHAQGGAVALLQGSLVVTDSVMEGNFSPSGLGGAVALVSGSARVTSGRFSRNSAREGGALHSSLDPAYLRLSGIAFLSNEASGGGDVFWLSKPFPGQELKCGGCEHEGPRSIATEVTDLRFSSEVPAEVSSGQTLPPFSVLFVDFYGNLVTSAAPSICEIYEHPSFGANETGALLTIRSKGQRVSAVDGAAHFDSLVVEGRLRQTYHLSVVCLPHEAVQPLPFTLKLSECEAGTEPDGSLRSCRECPFGSYNFDGKRCKPCPAGALCPGGQRVESLGGWWRNGPQSESLFECPFPHACLPGPQTGDSACKEGFQGPVCGICSDDHHLWGSQCKKCQNRSDLVLPIGAACALLLLLLLMFRVPLEKESVDATVKIRIFMSYLQTLGIIHGLAIPWPFEISSLLSCLKVVNIGTELTGPSCGSHRVGFYVMYKLSLCVPIASLALLFVIYKSGLYLLDAKGVQARGSGEAPANGEAGSKGWLSGDRFGGEEDDGLKRQSWKYLCLRNSLWLLVIIYPGMCTTVLNIFSRHTLDGIELLRSDYSVPTRIPGSSALEPTYRAYMVSAIVFAGFYPFGMPVCFALLLKKFHGRLDDRKVHGLLSVLHAGYKPRFYLFGVAEMVKKLCLSAIPVLVPGNGHLQIALGQFILFSYLGACFWLRPLEKHSYNLMQAATNGLAILVLISASLLGVAEGYDVNIANAAVFGLAAPGGLILFALCLKAAWRTHKKRVIGFASRVSERSMSAIFKRKPSGMEPVEGIVAVDALESQQ